MNASSDKVKKYDPFSSFFESFASHAIIWVVHFSILTLILGKFNLFTIMAGFCYTLAFVCNGFKVRNGWEAIEYQDFFSQESTGEKYSEGFHFSPKLFFWWFYSLRYIPVSGSAKEEAKLFHENQSPAFTWGVSNMYTTRNVTYIEEIAYRALSLGKLFPFRNPFSSMFSVFAILLSLTGMVSEHGSLDVNPLSQYLKKGDPLEKLGLVKENMTYLCEDFATKGKSLCEKGKAIMPGFPMEFPIVTLYDYSRIDILIDGYKGYQEDFCKIFTANISNPSDDDEGGFENYSDNMELCEFNKIQKKYKSASAVWVTVRVKPQYWKFMKGRGVLFNFRGLSS